MILKRYGADEFAYATSAGVGARVRFRIKGRYYQLAITMPPLKDFNVDRNNRARSASARDEAYWQVERQRWRALALVIKAKLEAVEVGIATIEEEFMGATILPGGETVAEWLEPQIKRAYELGTMPSLLALPEGRKK